MKAHKSVEYSEIVSELDSFRVLMSAVWTFCGECSSH